MFTNKDIKWERKKFLWLNKLCTVVRRKLVCEKIYGKK